ncbi:MAG: flavodoxin domain-containing protein [Chloroflexi bacterium]|nr:flavodoxin domain-containing protein [Chloroflexota bacterium]
MAQNVLVVYGTSSGSTAEVAQTIAQELQAAGAVVETRPLAQVTDLAAYDLVIIGAPMILGWQRSATNFVAKHQQALSGKRVALFMTCYSLTKADEGGVMGIPVVLDPARATAPKNPAHLSRTEKYALPSAYLGPVLKKAPQVKPVSVAFFGGKVDYSKLNPLAWLFVKLAIRAKAGDFRNWEAIKAWARGLLV